ncbi:hypothetical protein [Edaphobacter aggregans]|uniref:hypothetical protein n=1 Tax=Edaphobacter aggregans TaxID=570835 RepID=UPI000F748F7D|nr:hypothetical protein [Edaphobacter aggregans]
MVLAVSFCSFYPVFSLVTVTPLFVLMERQTRKNGDFGGFLVGECVYFRTKPTKTGKNLWKPKKSG